MKTTALLYPGSDRLRKPMVVTGALCAAAAAGAGIAVFELPAVALLLGAPIAVFFLSSLFSRPRLGMTSLLVWAFLGLGSARYSSVLPMGLGIDFLLLLTFSAFFLHEFTEIDWRPLKTPLLLFIMLWTLYNILELANPEAPQLEAWFYASRGICLYMVVGIPLALVLIRQAADLDTFIRVWFILSMLGTLWGIKQITVGLDAAERQWLSEPGNFTTHLLFGKLRVFSFYTDAGQFGAAQGHTAIAAIILALGPGSAKKRILYGIVGAASLYGMIISGTRGAFFVPVAGFGAYLLLRRNWRTLILGALVLAAAYGFLKFTYIGQDNSDIRRLRTALDPNDASFQARLINQRKLASYLESRPFGGGVGSAGFWGQRFNPNSFLAQLALDSWYVRIAAEYGYVGLVFYLLMLLYILVAGFLRVSRLRDPEFRQKAYALFAGLAGIAVASYGNQVWGQMPTGIILYFGIAFIFLSPKLDPGNHRTETGIDR